MMTLYMMISNAIIMVPVVLIMLQPDAGTVVVFTAFLFVLYREGLSYDPLILKITNAFPGIRFKQTWLGTHFIPIMFYVVFLCIITLLISKSTFGLFIPGLHIPGIVGIVIALAALGGIVYWLLTRMSSKREKKRAWRRFIVCVRRPFPHLPMATGGGWNEDAASRIGGSGLFTPAHHHVRECVCLCSAPAGALR